MGLVFLLAIAAVVVWAVRGQSSGYETRCPICDRWIRDNDELELVGGRWVHADCVEDA